MNAPVDNASLSGRPAASSHRPVVLIELNEVPAVVLDAYAKRSPFMARFLKESDRYTTVAADKIQLDPWIAWPSFHRGVNDEAHRLLHLGQDTAEADASYPPLWRILAKAGVRTGVYGSLFSNAEKDLEPYVFFVPDTFSPHDRVKPERLQAFQSFNLNMTRASTRNVDEKLSSGAGKALASVLLQGDLTFKTVARTARQIIAEKVNRRRLSRRRNVQTELHSDIFLSLLRQTRPQFATFYTNNVAAAMHRFWSAAFPDGSMNADALSKEWLQGYADEIFAALESVEHLLKRLIAMDATIIVASAIGQEEIPAEHHKAYVTILRPEKFVTGILGEGSEAHFAMIPAMAPDFPIRFTDKATADLFCERLGLLKIDGQAVEVTSERMHSRIVIDGDDRLAHIRHDYQAGAHFKHPFTVHRSDDHTVHLSVQFDDFEGSDTVQMGNETAPMADFGIGLMPHQEGVNCTAQHSAEGSLLVYGREGGGGGYGGRVSALDFVPSLLRRYQIPTSTALKGEPTIAL